MVKTNAMRLLTAAKIPFTVKEYPVDENDLSGTHVADKTGYLVCCIPVDAELDLKKVAKAAKDKKVDMIPMKDLLGLTGYVRGGCSPIGMKKKFPTYIEETAVLYDEIAVSAGVRGAQIIINPEKLREFTDAQFASLV